MDSSNAFSLSSPGSIFVAALTLAFLAHKAWPHLSPQKKTYKFSDPSQQNCKASSGLRVIKEPEAPEGWWSGRDAFELERRALFSKTWLYIAHSSQLTKPGAYQSFDIAGFPVFLICGKDKKIRAFHNVCRHRAYTITRKETGASTVLGCRYHGWSYDTTGKLVKAPSFDDVPGFNKSENSLFEIHTRTTEQGHVFVNLNAGEPAAFVNSTRSALDSFSLKAGLGSSEWVTGQTLTANFNWKLGMNDRHCTKLVEKLEQRVSKSATSSLASKLVAIAMQTNKQADCSLFPGTFLYSFENAGLWLTVSFFPASERTTNVRYDLFDCAPKATTDKSALARAVERPMQELVKDIELEFQSVSEESTGGSTNIHRILDCLQEHRKLEKTCGGQILPAMHQPRGSSLFQQAEQLCKELDCSEPRSGNRTGAVSGGLDW
ncbi:hypothetical protein N7532_002561 [Penicillium argentinense]|uniref:Rieske domain-containing protein n=1 Tax=Penicillium argentinense TaxID=1131581 RepID=A0A9W9G0K0_9EURO|nr:uncharacterized protein N7532_002561 [Penicillium argentinense]KAJ5109916.1 hypothetical protein N7532_002561 [Penicillium argentinense]